MLASPPFHQARPLGPRPSSPLLLPPHLPPYIIPLRNPLGYFQPSSPLHFPSLINDCAITLQAEVCGALGLLGATLMGPLLTTRLYRKDLGHKNSLQLFGALSSHRLNKDGCWLGALKSIHTRLGTDGAVLAIL